MTQGKSTVVISDQIMEEACGWFIDFNEGELDTAGRERFNQWLRRSPEHVRAYVEIAAAWQESSRLNRQQRLDMAALLTQTRAESNVVSLDGRLVESGTPVTRLPGAIAGRDSLASARSMKIFRTLTTLAAAALIAVVGIWRYTQRDIYQTQIGEQRTIVLTDGSVMNLNARSRVRVRFSKRERAVDLLEGQALFQVAKDVTRSFLVRSNAVDVRALGTQFDVYRKATGTVVTVLEGRVAVTANRDQPRVDQSRDQDRDGNGGGSGKLGRDQAPAMLPVPRTGSQVEAEIGNGAVMVTPTGLARRARTAEGVQSSGKTSDDSGDATPEMPILVSAGEQVTIAPQTISHPVSTDVLVATAWTQRKLIFNETPVAEVVAEFNRYNARQILIEDPSVAQFHVRGTFEATDPGRLIQLLRERFDIDVQDNGATVRIRGR